MSARITAMAAPGGEPLHEFSFGDSDFRRVQALIYRQAGISLHAGKLSMVYSRLVRRLRVLGTADFKTYLDDLEAAPGSDPEWQEFVNALTTNLTSFFRESHHFPLLAQHLKALKAQAPLRIWCCAASTGEEPYSLAMTAMETFGSLHPPVSIFATDIDTSVLATARAGIYGADAAEKLDPALRARYFLRGRGSNDGKVCVRDELRKLIDFQPLNLLHESWSFKTKFHAVFCRNVMIYFDKPTQYGVLGRLARHLTPDGLLFAGHSENFSFARDLFELEGRTVYSLATASRGAARLRYTDLSTAA